VQSSPITSNVKAKFDEDKSLVGIVKTDKEGEVWFSGTVSTRRTSVETAKNIQPKIF